MPKRKPQRKNRPGKPRKRRSGGLRRILLLIAGVVIGFMVLWIGYLNQVITTRFEGPRFAFPSRVYARALELYPGAGLSRDKLVFALRAAGYTAAVGAPNPGTFDQSGARFEIYRRAFAFPDGFRPARRISLTLHDGAVATLRSAGEALPIARLDPALIGRIYPVDGEDRRFVALDQVPKLLIETLIAVEDRDFRAHHGIDFGAIARAFWANLRAGEIVQGGSTLTQQLVKNYFLSREQTLIRKLNEALMAGLLEWHYDKGAILQAYLNEVYFGQDGAHAIHGIGRGAEFLFDRPVDALETHQIALLVGMLKAPSYYDPRDNPKAALQRRNRVLGIMAEREVVSAERARQAASRPLSVVSRDQAAATRYPAFLQRVREELAHDYRDEDLRAEGLMIFTTLSPWATRQARSAIAERLPDIESRLGLESGALETALVLVSPNTGEVLALIGGRRPDFAGFNRALDARRPVGSLIKPFVYLAALADGYSLVTELHDAPVSIKLEDGSSWRPENFDSRFHGEVALIEALAHSYNAATVRMGLTLGVANVLDVVHALGLQRNIPAYPSLLLGAQSFTPFEMAQLYQGIASGGYPVRLQTVSTVLDRNGDALSRFPLQLSGSVHPKAVFLLTRALQATAEWGTASALGAALPGLQPAGKTGTSDGLRDSWFAGFTGDRLAVAWVGRDDYQSARLTGANAALKIVSATLTGTAQQGLDPAVPPGIESHWVERDGPMLADEDCPGAVQLPFIEGTEPKKEAPCREDDDSIADWFEDLF